MITRIATGLIVGILVGLTGIGGGMVLMPLLISVLGVPPMMAVGSDAVIRSITKVGAGALHLRQGNISLRKDFNLDCGSTPEAVLGVMLLARVRAFEFSFGTLCIGILAGIMAGITSIGSGSLILLLPLVLCRYSPSVMVGTDIIHGMLLAGLAGPLQFRMGNLDPKLTISNLVGSIPEGLLGTCATKYLPAQRFKTMLCTILVVAGARMLWTAIPHAN
jgi:uncharacterized membrane protein YfcA